MFSRKVTFLFLLLILFSLKVPILHANTTPDTTSYFSEGLKSIQDKKFEKGLDLWTKAQKKLNEPDYRIAYHFIKVATEQNLRSYYQKASDIYYWGLSGEIDKNEKKLLLNDISHIKPLIKFKKYSELKKLIEKSNPTVFSQIKNLWDSKDRTPINDYNERLIEHWQRVAYVYKHYSHAGGKELDARASTYIRYGKPYYSRDGTLSYKTSFVHRVLLEGIQPPSFASQRQMAVTNAQRYNLETRIRQLHRYPKYEIWVYNNLTEEPQNTIFVFGNKGDSQQLEKIRSLSDFIPSEAYRNIGQHNYSSFDRKVTVNTGNNDNNSDVELKGVQTSGNFVAQVNITPALILQLMYYDQFAAFDEYFGKAYNQMMDQYISMSNTPHANMGGLSREFSTMQGSKLLQIQQNAPDEISHFGKSVFSLPSQNYTYRFLNKSNEPYLKVFSLVDLKDAIYHDQLKENNIITDKNLNGKYILKTGYSYNENSAFFSQSVSTKRVKSVGNSTFSINIPHHNSADNVILSYELHNSSQLKDSVLHENTPYIKSLKALGKYQIELPEQLNKNKLTTSDFIIGYSKQDNYDEISEDSLNFNIAHKKVIPQNSDLNLYYEVYNLTTEDNTASFSFEYTIKTRSQKNGLLGLGIFKGNSNENSITINNTAKSNSYKEMLIIETSKRKEGRYVLDVLVHDNNTGESFKKSIEFRID